MKIRKDLTGKKFGRLIVLKDGGTRIYGGHERRMWLCKCSCGGIVSIVGTSLSNGNTKSCGCLLKERITKHGMSKTSEFKVWTSMRDRCKNPKNCRYKDYGGRGISVCSRWDKFESFFGDMGNRPSSEFSIDRINNNGNYEPSNCKWSTRSEQQRNKQPYPTNNRLPRGDDHWTRKNIGKARYIARTNIKKSHKKGEGNSNAKMTYAKAIEMRQLFRNNPNIKLVNLGGLFGVGRETTRKVIKKIAWAQKETTCI